MGDDAILFTTRRLAQLDAALRGIALGDVVELIGVLEQALERRRRVFVAGNGGSAATANHLASDLLLGVARAGGEGFRVTSLCANVSALTASANDLGYEEVFAAQLRAQAEPGDALIVISGSGQSANIVRAAATARELGLQVIGLLGMDGGEVAALCDARVVVPSRDYDHIEVAHLFLEHLLTSYFRERSDRAAQRSMSGG